MEQLIKMIEHDCGPLGYEWLVRSNGRYGYYAHVYRYWEWADEPRPPKTSYHALGSSPLTALQDAYNKWVDDHV